jgi:L-threonylcarbamoyladenylate synthase
MTPPAMLDLRAHADLAEAVGPAVAHVKAGGLLAYPTETVYGFGGACSPEGVAGLRALKGREASRPFLVLVRDIQDIRELAWTPEAEELASIFWPGSLTLVLSDPSGIFPAGVRSPEGGVAVRVSPHPVVRALLDGFGSPLTSTSANQPGRPPALTGEAARSAGRALGAGSELLVLEVGQLEASGPSTIVDFTRGDATVLREGTIPVNRLRCALPGIHGR